MKKVIIKTISAMLVFVLSIFALSSCGGIFRIRSIFPEEYTGGFGDLDNGSGIKYYWVETYEELIAAMNLLRSHGSTFLKNAVLNYEGDLFDTKYCITISRFDGNADYVKFGDDPYDRWAKDVLVMSYGFFEDVTIDELVYSYVKCACGYNIGTGSHKMVTTGRYAHCTDCGVVIDMWTTPTIKGIEEDVDPLTE